MIYLYIVLIIEIFFCTIEYIHARAVFANPSFLAMIVITISSALGTIGNMYWNVKISPILVYTVLFGFLSIILADFLAKRIANKYHYSVAENIYEIKISNTKTNMVLILVVFCTLLYCADILRVGASMGHDGWRAIYAVKKDNSGTNVLIRQGVKIIMAAMFIHTFVFANNVLMLRKKGFKEFKHLIPALCAIVCSIFTSVRTEIFRVLTALMVCLCVLIFQRYDWKITSLKKFVKKIILYIVLGVILLVGVRYIVKGMENATSNTYDVLMYIIYYLGTPIIVLGSKLTEELNYFQGIHFGEITFNRFYKLLQNLGLFVNDVFQDGSKNVWIDQKNLITANVDTIFGPPAIDFGIVGMAVYVLILFYFLNVYYYRYIYKTSSSTKRNMKLITYSFFAAIPSMAFYCNYLNWYLTVYFVLTLILIKIIEIYYGFISPIFKRGCGKSY